MTFRPPRSILLPACLLLLVLLAGCGASRPTGRWVTSSDVLQTFRSGTILPHHTYYYTGSPVEPDAVIAIDNSFQLRTKVWSRVDITQKLLDRWMFWAATDMSVLCPYKAGIILAPDGRQVGVWFSKFAFNTIRSPEPGVIEVYLPFAPDNTSCGRESYYDQR